MDGEVVEAEADELKINCTSGKLVSIALTVPAELFLQWH